MSAGTPSGAASLGEVASEMSRLYGMPNLFLARALINLSRKAQKEEPALAGDPRAMGYESLLIRSVLPGLALSLGETGLTPLEQAGARALPKDPKEIRVLTGMCLNNATFSGFRSHADPLLRSLTLGFANGSPITIGLDRVIPPTVRSEDWVARHIREVSRARFGNERFSAWAPAMQDYPGRGRLAFKRRSDPEPDEDPCLMP